MKRHLKTSLVTIGLMSAVFATGCNDSKNEEKQTSSTTTTTTASVNKEEEKKPAPAAEQKPEPKKDETQANERGVLEGDRVYLAVESKFFYKVYLDAQENKVLQPENPGKDQDSIFALPIHHPTRKAYFVAKRICHNLKQELADWDMEDRSQDLDPANTLYFAYNSGNPKTHFDTKYYSGEWYVETKNPNGKKITEETFKGLSTADQVKYKRTPFKFSHKVLKFVKCK